MLNHATNGSEGITPAITLDALAASQSHAITYRMLLERHHADGSAASARSGKANLSYWLKRVKKTLDDPVNKEFEVLFEKSFSAFRTWLDGQVKSAQTAANVASTIRGLHRTYVGCLANADLPAEFSGALRVAMARVGVTAPQLKRQLAERHRGAEGKITEWLSGRRSPSRRSKAAVEYLERLLGLVPGTLTARAFADEPELLITPSDEPIAYREFQRALMDKRFGLNNYRLNPLPPRIEEAFGKITIWKKKEKHFCKHKLPGQQYVTVDPTERWNSESTVGMYRKLLGGFFGFLCLPKTVDIPEGLPEQFGTSRAAREKRYLAMATGLGMKPEDLRLTMALNHEILNLYVEFRKARNQRFGTTRGVEHDVGTMRSLVANEDIAFLRHHPEFGDELKPRVPEKNWKAWCDERSSEVGSLLRSLRPMKERTRQPDDPLKQIFKQQDPAMVVIDVARRMLTTLPPPSRPCDRAHRYRDAMVLLLITFEPLRARHWPELRIGKQICLDKDTGWWAIDIKAEEFKNWGAGFAKDRYRVLPIELSKIVDIYVNTYRQDLRRAAETDHLLLSANLGFDRNPGNPATLSATGFANIIRNSFCKYLGVSVGPHAIRHLLSTDYILKHHGDYEAIGALLNDSPKMAQAMYSHVEQKDHLSRQEDAHKHLFVGLDGPAKKT